MHKILRPKREKEKQGREYFDVDFYCTCELLKSSLNSEEKTRKQIESAISDLQNKETDKFDNDFYEFVNLVLCADIPDLVLMMFVMKGLDARTHLLNKEIADSGKNKELQEV